MVPEKCKFFSRDVGAVADFNNRNLIREDLKHMQEGIHVINTGDRLRGIHVFNVLIGEPNYVATILRDKVGDTTKVCLRDIADEHP